MAVTNEQSAQMAAERLLPVEDHGKLRIRYFDFTQGIAAGDATSTMKLCRMPYGRVRILPQLSLISWSAFGAGRFLDVGHEAYITEGGVEVAADYDALANDIDVVAADVNGAPIGSLIKWDMFSRKGVIMTAQVAGGTIPAGATLKGYFVIVHE